MPAPAFLTAEWRSLLMYNVPVDRRLLDPLVPIGTELDLWNGEALVSLVGFRFLNTRLRGFCIPFHRHFDEINLRFYVRRQVDGVWRRGVVFIKEIVGLPAVSCVARWAYHEKYVTRWMRHQLQHPPETPTGQGRFEYAWRDRGAWLSLAADLSGPLTDLSPHTDAEFILEHYWGYTSQPDGSTFEYAVEHPRWRIWPNVSGTFTGDPTALYGVDFAAALKQAPQSVIASEGSAIVVRKGTRLA